MKFLCRSVDFMTFSWIQKIISYWLLFSIRFLFRVISSYFLSYDLSYEWRKSQIIAKNWSIESIDWRVFFWIKTTFEVFFVFFRFAVDLCLKCLFNRPEEQNRYKDNSFHSYTDFPSFDAIYVQKHWKGIECKKLESSLRFSWIVFSNHRITLKSMAKQKAFCIVMISMTWQTWPASIQRESHP